VTEKAIEIQNGILGYEISALGITEIILRDFDQSWEYYKFNLEERRDIIARIYNFVGFPIFGIGLIIYFVENSFLNYTGVAPAEIATHSILVVTLVGLVLSITRFLSFDPFH
jgi:hypothetical protein